jgi:hypothetical protein
MEVSGQVHVPPSLAREKSLRFQLNGKLDVFQSKPGRKGGKKYRYPCWRSNPGNAEHYTDLNTQAHSKLSIIVHNLLQIA